MGERMKKLMDIRPKKIAIFRALQLGDMLCAIPAIRALKTLIPESQITLIGLPWARSFVQRFSKYFYGFIQFPGYPGLPEQGYDETAFKKFIQEVKREKFDLIIQLHGNGSIINPMIENLEAKYKAGYFQENTVCPNKNLFMEYPDDLPEIERHLQLLKFLGAPSRGKHLEFPLSKGEKMKFNLLCKKLRLNRKGYVCLHPGARDNKRWWSPEKFALIGDAIAQRGYQVLLTGTEIEKETVYKVEDLMEFPALNCVGKTDLGMLAALIKNSKMIFSNDTGVSHIAAAMKTPSVVVFLSSDPLRWAPLNKDLHQIILPQHAEDIKMILKKTQRVLLDETDTSEMEINL